MLARAKWCVNALLVVLFTVSVACAQNAPGPDRQAFAQQELDQMLAPIALYPDSLLTQILMAATYPNEVVAAARWSRDNPDLNGDRAVRAAERIDWDPSVKSLVAFPQIIDMMDAKINWTADLGDAFLDQQAQVMDTVQYLRRQAYEAGNLTSNDQFRVDVQDSNFVIGYANPEVAYVPYYDPLVIYGTWWWPAYQPVYWAPWAGYRVRPGYARGYAWGPGIRVSRGFFFGAPDWRRHSVHVVNVNNYYYRSAAVNRSFANAPGVWQHDATRRHDVPRRDAAWRQPAARVDAAPAARPEYNERRANVRQAPANPVAPAPANAARNEPARNFAAPRGRDSRGSEGRGEFTPGAQARTDSGNRNFERGNHQQIVGGMNAQAVAPVPAAAIAPAANNNAHMRSMPVPASPPAPAMHANGSAPAPAGEAGRRAENRPAAGREHAAANTDNNADAAPATARANGGDSGNTRHPR